MKKINKAYLGIILGAIVGVINISPMILQKISWDVNWNKELIVKLDMPQLIKEQLQDWDRGKIIYIGSKCDPYMDIEKNMN